MKFKVGVSLRGMQWQTFLMLVIVDNVHRRMFNADVVITSGTEGQHKHDTHGLGYAADFRSRDHTPAERIDFAAAVRAELPAHFQFFHEVSPDHYHGEYDPRVMKETVQ